MRKLLVLLLFSVSSVIGLAQDVAVSVYQPLPPSQSSYPSSVDYATGLLRGETPSLGYSQPRTTQRAQPKAETYTLDAYYVTSNGQFSKTRIQVTVDVYGAHVSAVYNRNMKTWSSESHPIYEVTRFDKDYIYNNFDFKSSSISYGTIYF